MKPRFQQHDPNDTGHVPTEEAVQVSLQTSNTIREIESGREREREGGR